MTIENQLSIFPFLLKKQYCYTSISFPCLKCNFSVIFSKFQSIFHNWLKMVSFFLLKSIFQNVFLTFLFLIVMKWWYLKRHFAHYSLNYHSNFDWTSQQHKKWFEEKWILIAFRFWLKSLPSFHSLLLHKIFKFHFAGRCTPTLLLSYLPCRWESKKMINFKKMKKKTKGTIENHSHTINYTEICLCVHLMETFLSYFKDNSIHCFLLLFLSFVLFHKFLTHIILCTSVISDHLACFLMICCCVIVAHSFKLGQYAFKRNFTYSSSGLFFHPFPFSFISLKTSWIFSFYLFMCVWWLRSMYCEL